MTYDDYQKISQGLTAENAPVVIGQILDNIKVDLEERDAFKTAIDEKDSKIKDLQDTNIKLFLNQSGPAVNPVDPEEEEKKKAEEEHTRNMEELKNFLGGK